MYYALFDYVCVCVYVVCIYIYIYICVCVYVVCIYVCLCVTKNQNSMTDRKKYSVPSKSQLRIILKAKYLYSAFHYTLYIPIY